MSTIRTTLFAFLLLAPAALSAHGGSRPVHLHVDPTWSECSFRLDASLTQQAWHEFTQEAGLAVYFRPLIDARPLGTGNYDLSILQWQTSLDDTKSAWNDTFVHPDSTHWLKEGPRLPIPGITVRRGLTDRIDVGAYWTKNPNSNYGVWGGQVQFSIADEATHGWSASARTGFNALYGPEDIDLTVYGIDLVGSKRFVLTGPEFTCAPYVGVSAYLSRSGENSAVVALKDESIAGLQGMAGIVTTFYGVSMAVEYNAAATSTLSVRLGAGF